MGGGGAQWGPTVRGLKGFKCDDINFHLEKMWFCVHEQGKPILIS